MRKRTSLNKPLRSAHNSEQRSVITTKIMEIEHSLAQSHTDQRAEEEARPAENIKHNPKYFSGYCKRFFKTKTQVSPQQDTEGSLSQDAKTTSQMLLLEEYNRVVSSS